MINLLFSFFLIIFCIKFRCRTLFRFLFMFGNICAKFHHNLNSSRSSPNLLLTDGMTNWIYPHNFLMKSCTSIKCEKDHEQSKMKILGRRKILHFPTSEVLKRVLCYWCIRLLNSINNTFRHLLWPNINCERSLFDLAKI